MDQHRMYRMSGNRHSTDNRFLRHADSVSQLMKKKGLIKRLPIVLSIFILFFLGGCKGPQSMLDPAGPAALLVSKLWWGMFIFFSLVFIVVCILWFYAMRSRDKEANKNEVERLSRYFIIGGGILLPTISISLVLLFGVPIGHSMLPLPGNQKILRINVTGHQWFWEVHYPDAGITLINELHLPLNQPIDIYATSHDVIHSFWVPRLNGKIDMIPGHTNILRIQATKPGHFRGQCAEFCGLWHARMLLDVEVHSHDEFNAWLKRQQASIVLSDRQNLDQQLLRRMHNE
ncbi:cytochrome c oxidase subunit II [Legionella israelensis]|nr:cytochrome c oxidase subunit II [Legionella israelensis]